MKYSPNHKHILLQEDERREKMFNFLEEIKNKAGKIDENLLQDYLVLNLSGRLLYVEGHQGLTVITPTELAFKIKKGRFIVQGEGLYLKELTENTMLIEGQINKVEKS